MKRFLAPAALTFLLANILCASLYAKDICHFVFRKNGNEADRALDMDLVARINRLEEWSADMRLSAYKNDPLTPTAARKSLKTFEMAEEKLIIGESLQAVSAYKTLFRRVEGAALVIERYEPLLKAMRAARDNGSRNYREVFRQEGVISSLSEEFAAKINGVGDLDEHIKTAQKLLRKRYRVLGKDFDSYNYARLNLAKLAKAEHCSPVCRQALKEFQQGAGLGAPGERELFKGLIGNKKGYSLKKIREIFNSHPEAVLVARKKEFLQEGFALFMKYANDFRLFKRLYTSLANSKWGRNSRLVKVFRSVYDQRFLETDSLIARRIAHSEGDNAKKFELMLKQTLETERDKFWVNFSRQVEGQLQNSWDDLLEYAKKTGSPFFERMKTAAEIGQKLGPINQSQIKGVKRTVALVTGLGLGWAYFNFSPEDQDGQGPVSDSDEEEPIVLIDYMSAQDQELTETMGELMHADRGLNDGNF